MILNSTKYKNPQRTILGAINFVFNGDTIILCDTALGIVNLTLLEIPNNQWNTTYKLYVADKSNNAGTNNITINAPVGYLINGASSLVISVNGGCALIRVTENKQYLASLTSGGGGSVSVINNQNPLTPPVTLTTNLDKLIVKGFQTTNFGNNVTLENAFISVDNSQIQFLQGNNLLIPNQWYNITDANYGNFNHNFNVYVPALTNNSISTFGIGEFYDADYQGFGNYSGIVGFAGQLGIWNNALITPINSVVIWNNLHYKNITGVNTLVDPEFDLVNWFVLPYSNLNGYILQYNEITYDGFKNTIYYRKDKFNNEVELYSSIYGKSFDKFPFGNYKFLSNKVLNGSLWDCCNTKVSQFVQNNILNFTELLWKKLLQIQYCTSNNFLGTLRPIEWAGTNVLLKIEKNNFSFCQGVSRLEECLIAQNNFFNSVISIRISGGTTIFANNVIGSTIGFEKTHGTFNRNSLNYSNFGMTTSDGNEQDNILYNSQVSVFNNSGFFLHNNVSQQVTLTINDITASGLFQYNTLNCQTKLAIDIVSSDFGITGTKGVGNIFSNCDISIGTFSGGFHNSALNKVQIIINEFNGAIVNCEFYQGSITLDNMSNNSFNTLTAKEFVYGSAGYIMPETYSGGVYTFGLANIKCTIDCADPLIYDPILFTLIIPNELRKWGGTFVLTNANLRIIRKILNSADTSPYKFLNDAGSTSFITTSVAGALIGELIYTLPAPVTLTIVYRVTGSDYIVTNRSGNAMAITETLIFV